MVKKQVQKESMFSSAGCGLVVMSSSIFLLLFVSYFQSVSGSAVELMS